MPKLKQKFDRKKIVSQNKLEIKSLQTKPFRIKFPFISEKQVNDRYINLIAHKKANISRVSSQALLIKMKQNRKWIKKTGKKLDFTDEQLNKIHGFFSQLDKKGQGFIGINQLFEPMISLGIVQNKQQLQKIIFSVDDDGDIHFSEFLNLLKIKQSTGSNALVIFFKNLLKGKVGQQPLIPSMPFSILIDKIRRQKIKDGLFSNKQQNKAQGLKVIKGYMKKLEEQGLYKIQKKPC